MDSYVDCETFPMHIKISTSLPRSLHYLSSTVLSTFCINLQHPQEHSILLRGGSGSDVRGTTGANPKPSPVLTAKICLLLTGKIL